MPRPYPPLPYTSSTKQAPNQRPHPAQGPVIVLPPAARCVLVPRGVITALAGQGVELGD